jgi:hypothetical protein
MEADSQAQLKRATDRLHEAQHDGHQAMRDARDAVEVFVAAMRGAGSWVSRTGQLGAAAQAAVGAGTLPPPLATMTVHRDDSLNAASALATAGGLVTDGAAGRRYRSELFKKYGFLKDGRMIDPAVLPEGGRKALSFILKAGKVAKVLGPAATVAGGVLDYLNDKADGESTGHAVREASITTAGGVGGGYAGGLLCGAAAVATDGVGAVTCPVLVPAGAAGGAWLGDKVNDVIDIVF